MKQLFIRKTSLLSAILTIACMAATTPFVIGAAPEPPEPVFNETPVEEGTRALPPTPESTTAVATSSADLVSETQTSPPPFVATSTQKIRRGKSLLQYFASLVQFEKSGLRAELKGKPLRERAAAKARVIAEKKSAIEGSYVHTRTGLSVEVLGVEEIEGGVQVLARAWARSGTQLGFGRDGSVDIERFRIFNPPVLVPDGTTETIETENGETYEAANFKEDPAEAVRTVVAQVVGQIGKRSDKIEPGKVGRTTDIFFLDTNPETVSIDGTVGRFGQNESWASIRTGPGTAADGDASSVWEIVNVADNTGTNWKHLRRAIYLFDTSALPDTDTISSATFSLYGTFKTNYYNQGVGVVGVSPASNTSLTPADFGTFGSTRYNSADINMSDWNTSGYNVFSFNTAGIAAVNATGVTKLGVRASNDIDGTVPQGTHTGWDGSRIEGYYADNTGTTNDPMLVIEHDHAQGMNSPLPPSGIQVSLGNGSGSGVTFSALFNDSDPGDTALHTEVQVAAIDDFSSMLWDSGKIGIASTTVGARSPEIAYGGSTLETGTTYYWRIKFWDAANHEGAWSTEPGAFTLAGSVHNYLQDITYTYDALGNITHMTDTSNTAAAKTAIFAYDSLSRLTSAHTESAAQGSYSHTYTYNALGNITNGPSGTYAYAGTNYANPHAATSIGGATLAYDSNGNMISHGTDTYAFDYRNRLASSTVGGVATTYGYDHAMQRVSKTSGGVTTVYPSPQYNTKGTTITKHIYLGDTLAATVETIDGATKTYYVHPDHLGGTNVVTDENGNMVETTDYYPFGEQRINTGDFDEQRKFTGHEYDMENDLTYANARYYDQNVGRWLSLDPASRDNPGQFLKDPQQLNTYSYARNNPLVLIDPFGLWVNNKNGSFIAEKGDTLSGLQQETGRNWQESNFDRNPKSLQVGENISFNKQKTSNSLVIDSSWQATKHYFSGFGNSVGLGLNTQNALRNSSDQQYRQNRIISGLTESDEGNYGVDLTNKYPYVGNTVVEYHTTYGTKYGVTTFTGFVRDGYWDVVTSIGGDGIGPKREIWGATPYSFEPYSWTISYPKPQQR